MARSKPPVTRKLTAEIAVAGHRLSFHLFHRPLALGDGLTARYYWMDTSKFRVATSRRGQADPVNFRNLMGHGWATAVAEGRDREPGEVGRLLLANCHALVSRRNALQQVYRDAHVAPDGDPRDRSLRAADHDRVMDVLRGRDLGGARATLDDWLGWHEPPREEAALHTATLAGILGHGVALVRGRGNAGLEEFLGRVDAWYASRLKKGRQGWLRGFLARFAFECKVAFHHTYGDAWRDLGAWLRREQGLDETGARFLQAWHVPGGVLAAPDGTPLLRGLAPALHPLSGFFMQDPALCALAGPFFTAGAADRDDRYWNFLGAFLTAAGLYRQALEHQQVGRGVYVRSDPAADRPVHDARDLSLTEVLGDYPAHAGLACPGCHYALSARPPVPADVTPDGLNAGFTCRRCGRQVRHLIRRSDLAAFLTADF